MLVEHDVVLRNVPHPLCDALRAEAERRIQSLERFHERLISCRVVVEPSSQHHRLGNVFHVRVDVVMPGAEVVVRRDPPEDHAHADPFVALRDAFDAARRRIEDHVREQDPGRTRVRAASMLGRVTQVFPDRGYGFLEDAAGNGIYFQRHVVRHDAFDRLEPGDEVRFVAREGDRGLQASSVELVKSPRPSPG